MHCIGGGVCSIAAKNIYLCSAGIGQRFLLSSLTKPNQLTLSTAARVLHTWTRLVYELKSKCLHVDQTCQEIELRVFTSGSTRSYCIKIGVTLGPSTVDAIILPCFSKYEDLLIGEQIDNHSILIGRRKKRKRRVEKKI